MFTRCIRVYRDHRDGFDNCCNHDEHRPVERSCTEFAPQCFLVRGRLVGQAGHSLTPRAGPVGPPSWTTAGGRDKKIYQE
jgi:hypothetical protein